MQVDRNGPFWSANGQTSDVRSAQPLVAAWLAFFLKSEDPLILVAYFHGACQRREIEKQTVAFAMKEGMLHGALT